jgi:hypothetical protein
VETRDGESTEDHNLKASDADRQQVADRLGTAVGEGRLTLQEYRDRAGQTCAARTHGELDRLVADLPATRRSCDTLGYDLIVEQSETRLFFEVKASAREPGEFVLTTTEITRARSLKRRERYYLLYVTHALNSDLRRIYRLPNPLDPKSARFFRSVGEGLHYRFALQPRS